MSLSRHVVTGVSTAKSEPSTSGLMPQLAAVSTEASPHAWGAPLKTLYAAHIAAGLGNVAIIEGVPGHTLGTDGDGYDLSNGHLTLSDRPGFGIPWRAEQLRLQRNVPGGRP
ncbi:enolase C-terminal domain-like protein [Kribbella sp. NPDC023972]|uniref:enolase C-terminal domain-like protein n=1 Tax=Kribbella sp. NPDC023972 TaxID=3154795 RepID=UPI0034043078